ncbi:MAG: phosphodiester glycosidase family protein [Myxococcales bacterium]|nr:phosphodiester glycosidase family protein [Myxococcales bacterium]
MGKIKNFIKKMAWAIPFVILAMSADSPFALATPKAAYIWNKLAEGIQHASYSFVIGEKERVVFNAFKIDPKLYRFDILMTDDEVEGATVFDLARKTKPLIAINGGFFTPEHRSIGLIVRNGKILNGLHKTSWWSIFSISDGVPSISKPSDFVISENISIALQVGPRLAINGVIPKLKENLATRSALGISEDGMVVIAITSGYGISMTELARRMTLSPFQGGLDCKNAMALDGGSSSQIFAKIGNFEYSQSGLARITNALAVFKK